MWPRRKNKAVQDWGKFWGDTPESSKQRLISLCEKNDVSIYIDDAAEQSTGFYSSMRPVASEAELERRLVTKLALKNTSKANWIAGIALFISVLSLIVSIAK